MSEQGPTVFGGRYELHRRLARGGMAEVFLARDQLLDRPVAVKVLFQEFAADPSFVERFRREAQAAANLSHPNIVGVYDWGREGSTYYIVMEYVEGRSLSDVIRNEGPLSPSRVAEIASDVAAALGFAHKGDVVHRDMKSGNVIVSPTGQVKVADFGIATAISGGAQAGLTQTGAVMGTATYFSPEQAQGKPLDGRSDLYSLGVVMYEMLTGRPPFAGDNPVSIAYKHVQEMPEPIAALRPGVPMALQAITAKLLNKDPELRYPTAADLQADLRRFQAGTSALAPAAPAAPPAPATPAPAAPAEPLYAPLASAPVAAPAAPATQVNRLPDYSAGGYGGPPGDPYQDDYYDDYDRPERRTGLWVAATVALLALLIVLIVVMLKVFGGGDGASTTPTVTVPNVTELDRNLAVQKLNERGLELGELTSEVSEDIPEDRIISQDPPAGTEVDEGTAVNLVFSAGPDAIEVPVLVGLTEEAALFELTRAGFETPEIRRERVNDVEKGTVAAQQPEAGQKLAPTGVVIITVSEGPLNAMVPNLEGQTEADAKVKLEDETLYGWVVTIKTEASADIEKGFVIGTNPTPGSMLEIGMPIELIVSSGPAVVRVPNVIGKTQNEAKATLEAAGLVWVPDSKVITDPATQTPGRIIDQLPAGGVDVEEGAEVTIFVGVEPDPTPTPVPTATATPVPAPTPTPMP